MAIELVCVLDDHALCLIVFSSWMKSNCIVYIMVQTKSLQLCVTYQCKCEGIALSGVPFIGRIYIKF